MSASPPERSRAPVRLLPGDPAPWFFAPTAANPRYNFASVAGRYVVLAFPGPVSHPAGPEARRLMQAAQAEGLFDDDRAAGFIVTIDPADEAAGGPQDAIPGLRIFRDRDGAVSRLYGLLHPPEAGARLRYAPCVFLLDPLLRIIAVFSIERLAELLGLLRRLPTPALHAGFELPAPVLVLPRVMEPALCREFIAAYEAGGGQDSGFMIERDGKTVGMYDHATKRRRDQEIGDERLCAMLRACITRRIAPEMRKAFQFNPTRIERYIVARYDSADGGHFRAHRDNTTPGTAHRRFAVTINLNDDFEGGELWFPEFSTRRYRPPLGGAVVFSCSVLHEATPVTRGVRFATLPFLYDDAAAKVRERNAHSLETPEAQAAEAAAAAQ